jgi:ABC-type iron transport system FetAB ATPase subunit
LGPVDFALAPAEIVVLSGPSGSGKTLLLRALADLDPHTGVVLLDGSDAGTMTATSWRRSVALLPAESAWWADQVLDHMASPAADQLAALGLAPEALDWSVSRLSSGERQRLALLRVLGNRPRVLLLDEPSANLDSENILRVESLVHRYRDETGAAVLWVSHDPAQRERVGDRRLAIEHGRLGESRP